MKKVSYDNTFGVVDLRVYTDLMAEDNHESWSRLKRNLVHAIKNDLTPKQREYMILYYSRSYSMVAIARDLGVNKSTVSRTIKRGRARLYRCLKYGASNLLEQAEY